MPSTVIERIKFDPSKLTNFLNAQSDAERRVEELNRQFRGTGKVHGIQRHRTDELTIVRYDYGPYGDKR